MAMTLFMNDTLTEFWTVQFSNSQNLNLIMAGDFDSLKTLTI